jgi:HEAT repeat protein
MATTLEQVRALLDAEEPNYASLARLGPEILPHLRTLIAGGDEYYAIKAASLASHIDHDHAVDVLRDAATHASPRVRLAVAGGMSNMKRPAAAGVLMALLDDRDAGVRKHAVKASGVRSNPALLAKIGDISRSDPASGVRTLASEVLSRSRLA